MVVGIRKVLSFAIIFSMLTTNFCWAVGDRHQDIESGRTARAKQIPLETVKAAYKGDPAALAEIKKRIDSHVQLSVQDALRRAQALEVARSHIPSDEEQGTELRVSSGSSGRGSDEERRPLLASDERKIPAGVTPCLQESTPSPTKTSLGSSPHKSSQSSEDAKSSPRDHSPRGDAGDPAYGDESQYDEFFCASGDIPPSLHAESRINKEFPEGGLAYAGSLVPHTSASAEFEDTISPETAAKMMAFLNYFERYVVENRTTWKQRGAMVAAVVMSAVAFNATSSVYEHGINYLIRNKLPLGWLTENETNANIISIYILLTSLIDIVGRHILSFSKATAPSTTEFSKNPSYSKRILNTALGAILSVTPALMQLYLFIEAEERNMEVTDTHGLNNQYAYGMMIFGWAYALDGYTWSFDQISSFLTRANNFLFSSSIPHALKDSSETFREETLNKLSAFKNALFWAPREMLEPIYAAVFDPAIDTDIENTDPNATSEVKAVTKGLMQLQYILSLAKEFSYEKEETSASSIMVKGISTLMALAAAPMRFLTLQTVFSLMLTTFSGGYIPDDTGDTISIALAVLGSFPQGFAEFEGNVEFSELFSSHKPHHHSAYTAVRIPGQIFSLAQGIFNLIPLLSFCVFETDEHFDGNLAILAALSAPFLFPEFTSSVVALSITYAQALPKLIGRLGMGIARKFGAGTLTGEMRDELIRIVESLEGLVENLSPEVLWSIKNPQD